MKFSIPPLKSARAVPGARAPRTILRFQARGEPKPASPRKKGAEDRVTPNRQRLGLFDSVAITRDIPGTDLRKGMRGTIVEMPHPRSSEVEVEITDPPSVESVNIADLALLHRY